MLVQGASKEIIEIRSRMATTDPHVEAPMLGFKPYLMTFLNSNILIKHVNDTWIKRIEFKNITKSERASVVFLSCFSFVYGLGLAPGMLRDTFGSVGLTENSWKYDFETLPFFDFFESFVRVCEAMVACL